MPDPKNLARPDLLSKQAGVFIDAAAPGLAEVMEPFRSFGHDIPHCGDLSRQATAARIDYLLCLLKVAGGVAGGDPDAADILAGRLPRVANLRPATTAEAQEIETLADLAEQAPPSPFGPRRLGRVPPLDGHNLEDLEAAAEHRGVGALLPAPEKDGAACGDRREPGCGGRCQVTADQQADSKIIMIALTATDPGHLRNVARICFNPRDRVFLRSRVASLAAMARRFRARAAVLYAAANERELGIDPCRSACAGGAR